MDLSSRLRDKVGGVSPFQRRRQVPLVALLGVVASLLVLTISDANSVGAQSAATIEPNISTTTSYNGPDVVLSGTATSPNAVAGVTVRVQDTATSLYVQDSVGTMGPAAVELQAYTALLPPPGDMSVSWRVPMQLVDGDYSATITATESTGLTTTSTPLAFTVRESVVLPDTVLIAQDAIWSYYDQGEPSGDWSAADYDASAWPTGSAQLGFGDGETTTISNVDANGNPISTAYFRHDFSVVDPNAFDEIALTMKRDDGAVIYVNGQEWARSNMKDNGPIRYTNLAKSDSNEIVVGVIDPSLLVVGQNNIAVEVHQVSLDSPDLSFWFELLGTQPDEPGLQSDARPGTYVLTAGDMARCEHDGDEQVAAVMSEYFDTDAGVFIGLGDLVYNSGTIEEFESCYGPTIGQFKNVTWPSPGNHEHYTTPNAAGYRDYFGEAAGPLAGPAGGLWYSFDIDEHWHVIALDSDCRGVEPLPGALDGDGCAVGSEQEIWLRADLEANADKNILAFFHHPPYTNNHYTDHQYTWPLWKALTEYGTDITLHGHEHHYERYTPMNGWGEPDALYGAREFIVGSGGTYPRYNVRNPDPRSEFKGVFPNGSFDYGLLQLWLRPDGYDWKWEPVIGLADTDEGSSGLVEPFPKAVIAGTVTESTANTPIGGISVCAVAARDNVETCTTTNSGGAFALPSIFIDDYTLNFIDPAGSHTSATQNVTLTSAGLSVPAQLERQLLISGRMTVDGTGASLVGGQVCITPVPADSDGCATVGTDGSWQLLGVQAGEYTVEFSAPGFVTECYFNSEGCDAPSPVTVLPGTDLTGINAGVARQSGDVNCDGTLNILDAFTMAQFAVELRTDNGPCPLLDAASRIYLGNGDANLDGTHNIVDAYGLAECAVGLVSDFCPAP